MRLHSDEARDAANHHEQNTLGILTAPELPEEIIDQMKGSLPELLKQYVDEHIDWTIKTLTDPLSGTEGYSKEIMRELGKVKEEENWDLIISITDLPIFFQRRLIVADADVKKNIAYISIPALGAAPVKKRVREAIIQLVDEMHHGAASEYREEREGEHSGGKADLVEKTTVNKSSRDLTKRRFTEWISPIKRQSFARENSDVDVRYLVESRFSGFIRMITGMVLANRPWTIFPAFKKVLAAAFATGAYGLIFPNLWLLANAYSTTRLITMMMVAITAMVAWIIVVHHLWEKKQDNHSSYLANLYNVVTALTLGIGVVFYYMMLYGIFLITVFLFIPPLMLEYELGRDVGVGIFFVIAWLVTSVATLVGAIGAGLESENTILKATYGHRQQIRRQQAKEEREKEEESGSTDS